MYLATPLNHPSKKHISVSTHQNSTKISYCPPTLRYRHQVHTQEISPPVASGFSQSNHGMNYICHEVAPSLASSSESYSTQSAVSSDDESSHFRPDHRSTRTATVHTPRNTNNQDLKYKITLCKAWEENGECNFGFKCRYAHGENDLRYPRLYGRDHVGLLDKEFYHTRPCFPHVAIGTCPMYERCHAIHDAAVEGPSQQTVRHKEIGEEFFASHLHQHQKATDHYGTPFGSALPVSSSPSQLKNVDHADALCNDDAAYDSLYNRLCNTPQGDSSTTAAFKGKCTISEQHKVEIALAMRGNNPENCCSKYQPTHIAYVTRFGIPCMVKTERVFQVQGQPSIGNVEEIPKTKYNELNPNHIFVQEIAFGTIDDPKVQEHAIWFNFPKAYLLQCPEHESKNFSKNQANAIDSIDPKEQIHDFVSNSSCSYFMLYPTMDHEAFNLQTDILIHRLQSLTCNEIENVAVLKEQEQQLKSRFKNLKKHWAAWSWPVNCGRENVDENTQVLHVQERRMYSHPSQKQNPSLKEGQVTERIWNDFISTMQGKPKEEKSRLPIFRALKNGVEITPPSVKAETLNGSLLDFPLLNEFESLIEAKSAKLIQSN